MSFDLVSNLCWPNGFSLGESSTHYFVLYFCEVYYRYGSQPSYVTAQSRTTGRSRFVFSKYILIFANSL
jgi:hypothetical protein